jgi:hypothetical protein
VQIIAYGVVFVNTLLSILRLVKRFTDKTKASFPAERGQADGGWAVLRIIAFLRLALTWLWDNVIILTIKVVDI